MYSFDVFDTIITRSTIKPSGIFCIMQNILLQESKFQEISMFVKKNFVLLRMNSEALARKVHVDGAIEDISFTDIYDVFVSLGYISKSQATLLMELELEIEYECSVGIQNNIDKVKKLLNEGENVVLISDMYLCEDDIRKLLVKSDEVFNDIKIYVSSKWKKVKSSGNLFWIVKEQEGVSFSDWTHCGDNLNGDAKAPGNLGILTEPFVQKKPLKTEIDAVETFGNDGFVEVLMGTALNLRIYEELSKAQRIGACTGGVLLYAYVFWVLQQSIRKGIKRLYFVARDGYILKEIAQTIICENGYDITCTYIYGSRKAWRMPSVTREHFDLVKIFKWSHAYDAKNISELAEIFQITVTELKSFLPKVFENVSVLSRATVKLIEDYLKENERFLEYLIEKQSPNRELIKRYLKENVDFSDERFAFVELTGTGYTQVCLSHIISDFYSDKIITFYLKLDNLLEESNCIFRAFLPNRPYLSSIIEVLCRAPHGQTIGYEVIGESVMPIIETREGEELEQYGVVEYIDGIRKYTEKLCIAQKILKRLEVNVEFFTYLIKNIIETDNEELINFLGGMPYGITGREETVVEYAPELSTKEIINIFLFRENEPLNRYYSGTLIEFSCKRGSKLKRWMLSFLKNKKYSWWAKGIRKAKGIISKRNYEYYKHTIPMEILGKNIVIYAAGAVGKAYYKQIRGEKGKRVVLWVDRNWSALQEKGLPVCSPDKILEVRYDTVLIAVEDASLGRSIKDYLINLGVNEDKIVFWG